MPTRDASYCGSPSVSCTDGWCSNGQCQPASGLAFIAPVATPDALALAGDTLCFLDRDARTINAASTATGATRVLATDAGTPVDLTYDGTYAYWTSTGAVMRVDVSQGASSAEVFANAAEPQLIALSPTLVAWTESNSGQIGVLQQTLHVMPKGGGGPTMYVIPDDFERSVRALAVDDTYAFIGTSGDVSVPNQGIVYRLRFSDSQVSIVAWTEFVSDILLADGKIFYSADGLFGTQLESVDPSGASTPTLLLTVPSAFPTVALSFPLVADAESVYMGLTRVSLCRRAVLNLANVQTTSTVVDDSFVYFAAPGYIGRIAK